MLVVYINWYSNPGKFYKEITLQEGNEVSDKKQTKQLLQNVVGKVMEVENEAEKIVE